MLLLVVNGSASAVIDSRELCQDGGRAGSQRRQRGGGHRVRSSPWGPGGTGAGLLVAGPPHSWARSKDLAMTEPSALQPPARARSTSSPAARRRARRSSPALWPSG